MAANPVPKLTAAEYLAREEAAPFRSEFVGGEVFAMAAGSYSHFLLTSNLCGELRNELRGKPCNAGSSELLFRPGTGEFYTYPDVLVFSGPPKFADDQRRVSLNPIVVAEVLSPSTEGFDRGRKSAKYRKSESVQQYLLVSQDQAMVEIYSRESDGSWRLNEVTGLDGMVALPSIEVVVPMRAIYEGVEFVAAS